MHDGAEQGGQQDDVRVQVQGLRMGRCVRCTWEWGMGTLTLSEGVIVDSNGWMLQQAIRYLSRLN
jgi:hypothetical protein